MCHENLRRTHIFVTTPYRPQGEKGELRAVRPGRCPFAEAGDELGCRLRLCHRRMRSTGPRFALDVVQCAVHGVSAFTLYPPGHVPYGRAAVVPASCEGEVLRSAETGEVSWDITMFDAGIDASNGQRWPADSPPHDDRRRRTQGRRIVLTALILGITVADDVIQTQQAVELEVPTMQLRSAARCVSGTLSWTKLGLAIVGILNELRVDRSLLARLLAAGALASAWPAPLRWDPDRDSLLRIGRSVTPVRPIPDDGRQRGPPPTNSLEDGPQG